MCKRKTQKTGTQNRPILGLYDSGTIAEKRGFVNTIRQIVADIRFVSKSGRGRTDLPSPLSITRKSKLYANLFAVTL